MKYRRKAHPFTAPAQLRPELVVGVVIATGEPVSVDSPTLLRSTQAIAGHLRVLGLELVPVEKARRPWWRPNRVKEAQP